MANLTGIRVADECIAAWNDIKIGHKHRFVTFGFSDDKKFIVVDKKADQEATYDDFLDALPPKQCRYAVYDYEFTCEDGSVRNKLVFVVWAPDTAPARLKMIVAGSRASIKSALSGISLEMQATDDSEIQEDIMKQKCLEAAY